MKNSQGLKNRKLETTKDGRIFTWRAKTEDAWAKRKNANLLNHEEWVCIGTRKK